MAETTFSSGNWVSFLPSGHTHTQKTNWLLALPSRLQRTLPGFGDFRVRLLCSETPSVFQEGSRNSAMPKQFSERCLSQNCLKFELWLSIGGKRNSKGDAMHFLSANVLWGQGDRMRVSACLAPGWPDLIQVPHKVLWALPVWFLNPSIAWCSPQKNPQKTTKQKISILCEGKPPQLKNSLTHSQWYVR